MVVVCWKDNNPRRMTKEGKGRVVWQEEGNATKTGLPLCPKNNKNKGNLLVRILISDARQ